MSNSASAHLRVEQEIGLERARQRRLEQINGILQARGLKKFKRLGERRNGEWEILEYVSDSGNAYYRVVTFLVLSPSKEVRPYNMIFNAGHPEVDGAVVIPVIGDQVATIRQHRVTLVDMPGHGWLEEFPRGFAFSGQTSYLVPRFREEPEDVDVTTGGLGFVDNIPLDIVGREIRPLVASGQARLTRLVYLDEKYENSGTSRVVIPVYLAVFLADVESCLRIKGTRQQRINLYKPDELIRDRRKIGIKDDASMAALLILREFLDGGGSFSGT